MESGKVQFAAAAASCAVWSATPASTVMVRSTTSSSLILFIRESESTTWVPSALGVAPPIMPVLPPWGTIAIRLSAQNRTIDATSAAEAGRTTAGVCPW